MVTKIAFHKLDEWIMEKLFKESLSPRKVEELLWLEKSVKISYGSIATFKKEALRNVRETLSGGKEEYRQKLAEIWLDTLENLVEMAVEIKMKLDEFRDYNVEERDENGEVVAVKKDWQAHSRYLELGLKHLHLLLKRSKEIGPDIQTIRNTINIADPMTAIKDRVVSLMEHLLNNGVPLEKFPEEWQDLYKRLKGKYAQA